MRRREFIAQLTTTIAWPVIALAQTKVWRIAMLETATAELNKVNLATFKRRLEELGYIEGRKSGHPLSVARRAQRAAADARI